MKPVSGDWAARLCAHLTEGDAGKGMEVMAENRYFQKALSDFTYETASGGAIRHLTDSGYTVQQIMEHLDYPTPYERVQKTVWEQLLARGVILRERPGSGGTAVKTAYVKEYDRYGKSSFRRVVVEEEKAAVEAWREECFRGEGDMAEALLALLEEKRRKNGTEDSYASFSFGQAAAGAPLRFEAMLAVLDMRQREYVAGLPWENRMVYHRLDPRMTEILAELYQAGLYSGECCFLKTRERLTIG